jgi:hypothetical protein
MSASLVARRMSWPHKDLVISVSAPTWTTTSARCVLGVAPAALQCSPRCRAARRSPPAGLAAGHPPDSDRDLIDASIAAVGVRFSGAIVASEVGFYKPALWHWRASMSPPAPISSGTHAPLKVTSTTSSRRLSSASAPSGGSAQRPRAPGASSPSSRARSTASARVWTSSLV